MSTTTSTIHGYGIIATEIEEPDVTRLRTFIAQAQSIKRKMLRWLSKDIDTAYKIYNNMSVNDICNLFHTHSEEILHTYYSDEFSGLTLIVYAVLSEALHLTFTCCTEMEYPTDYILFEPCYPWEYNTNPVLTNIKTEDDMRQLFSNLLSILTDQPMDEMLIGEHHVEVWG